MQIKLVQSMIFSWILTKNIYLKVVHPLNIKEDTIFHGPTSTGAVLQPLPKSEHSFWNS
jgi:hypothetical protein